jgi:integrase
MKKKRFQKPTPSPASPRPADAGPPNQEFTRPMFAGLHIREALESLKSCNLVQPGQIKEATASTIAGQIESATANPASFFGLNLTPEVRKTIKDFWLAQRTQADRPVANNQCDLRSPAPKIRLSTIRTADVIESLLKVKKNKRAKESTLDTYKKRMYQFERIYPFLPIESETIMDYLSQFDGETGRHQRNTQDILNMTYEHAVRRFSLAKNPVAELERPLVTHKPIKTLSLNQVRLMNKTTETPEERVALDLLLGHGWRQIEVRRVLVADVLAIENNLILVQGKERPELTPILPETAARLRDLATGLKPEEYIFRAQQTRHGQRAPLGADGMSQLIDRLFKRAGLLGFNGHDLRRTFATLVTTASGDECLAMRLLRDNVPGLSNRYINYPIALLVEALQKYSPLRQAGEESTPPPAQAEQSEIAPKEVILAQSEAIQTQITPNAKASPVSETEEARCTTPFERKKGLVETGEDRSLPETMLCFGYKYGRSASVTS